MKNLVPESTLTEIRLKVDIVELISQSIPLKGAGRNYKALCPFHSEKTPSFMVNPEKQIFHCFGCGAGGDVFSFIMRIENITFPEAIEILAAKAGVVIPKSDFQPHEVQKKTFFEATERIAAYFERLFLNDERAREARDYLRIRGLKRNAVEIFRIGFCPFEEELVLREFNGMDLNDEILEKIGILTEKRDGRHLRFRGRIIFPIQDVQGRVAGFGGRALGERLPKYLNSPETPLFSKSHILYGLNHAKRSILQNTKAILVEGYLDVISVFCAGVENVVASLGTAFNESHVHLLKRYAQEVIVAYDGDPAGIEASLRALEVFLDQDIIVKIAKLPQGHDPDSWIKKSGKESFDEIINDAPTMMDFKLEILMDRFKGDKEKDKLMISREMLRLIKRIKNPILQEHNLRLLSQKLDISEVALREELRGVKKVYRDAGRTMQLDSEKDHQLEEDILRILLMDNKLLDLVKDRLEPNEFERKECNLLIRSMLGEKDALQPEDYLVMQQFKARLLVDNLHFKDPKTSLEKLLIALKIKSYSKKCEILNHRLKNHEKYGKDKEGVSALLSELQNIQKKIDFLKKK